MNSLRLGIRAHDVDTQSLESLLLNLKTYAFSHIQLAPAKSFKIPILDLKPADAQHISEKLKDHKLRISILGSYVNMSSNDPDIRNQALKTFKHNITLAAAFGSPIVASETGSVLQGYTLENYSEKAYQVTLKSMRELMAFAEKNKVTVALEAGINHPIHSAPRLKQLCDDINSPNLKVILDVANLMNPDNFMNQETIINQAFDLYGESLVAIHLKDFIYTGTWIKFVPLGTGLLNLPLILKRLKQSPQAIDCLLEATQAPYIQDAITLCHQTFNTL